MSIAHFLGRALPAQYEATLVPPTSLLLIQFRSQSAVLRRFFWDPDMLCLTSSTALLGAAVIVFSFIVFRLRDYAKLKHIPGPFWTGFTDLWMLRGQLTGRMNFILYETNKKYGKYLPSLCD